METFPFFRVRVRLVEMLAMGALIIFYIFKVLLFFFLLSNVISFSVFTLSLDIKGLETSIYYLPPSTVNILGMRSIGKFG